MLMLKDQDVQALKKFLQMMRENLIALHDAQQAEFLLDRITAAEHGYKGEDHTCP